MAPPPPGSYRISNPSGSTFVGLAPDNKTLVGYSTIDKAQKWEVGSDGRIATVLSSGETRYVTTSVVDIMHTLKSSVIVAESGHAWYYVPFSPNSNLWMIVYSEDEYGKSLANRCLLANYVAGPGVTFNSMIAYESAHLGVDTNWVFIPFNGSQPEPERPVWNQAVVSKDLFSISTQTLQKIVADMLVAFRDNLNVEQNPPSMIPTYVTRIPDGTEKGSFLALTMADKPALSYFELDGASDTSKSYQMQFDLTPSLLGGPANELFAYIAQRIKEAVVDWHLPSTRKEPLLMGITFAFPVEKTSLDSGKLLRWTKDVTDKGSFGGTVGMDVVKLLQSALDHMEGLYIKCNALINDTTATLLAEAYESGECEIGAIFDNGTNGAYVEAAANVKSLNLKGIDGQMVLNTEWGSFENIPDLQRTQFDYRIDRESAHPGKQIFEKLVSSTSIGELVRLVLLYYIDTGIPPLVTQKKPLFNRISSEKLNSKGAIDIKMVWSIDAAKNNEAVQQLLVRKLGLSQNNVTEEDGNTVKEICRAILLRTARLGACAIASILVLMGRAAVGGGNELGGRVGINGSLIRSEAFQRDMKEALREIIGADATKNVLIAQVTRDRTNLGAAVCACLAST